MNDADSARAGFREQGFEGGRFFVAANPQFGNAKILDDGVEAVEMVVVRVGERDDVEALEAAGPEVGRDDFFADVGASAIAAGPRGAGEAAAVDEHSAAIGEGGEDRVTLADIEDVDGELAALKRRPEGMGGDEYGERGEGERREPFGGANGWARAATREAGGSLRRDGGPGGSRDADQRGEKRDDEPGGRSGDAIGDARPAAEPIHDGEKPCSDDAEWTGEERGEARPDESSCQREKSERHDDAGEEHAWDIAQRAGEADAMEVAREHRHHAPLNDGGEKDDVPKAQAEANGR